MLTARTVIQDLKAVRTRMGVVVSVIVRRTLNPDKGKSWRTLEIVPWAPIE
jgi:hypothetical protein